MSMEKGKCINIKEYRLFKLIILKGIYNVEMTKRVKRQNTIKWSSNVV